nr:hypothetical protein [uncultured Mediterranean phage uvMED]
MKKKKNNKLDTSLAGYHGITSRLVGAVAQTSVHLQSHKWNLSIMGRVISILLYKRTDLLEEIKNELQKDLREDPSGKVTLTPIMADK